MIPDRVCALHGKRSVRFANAAVMFRVGVRREVNL